MKALLGYLPFGKKAHEPVRKPGRGSHAGAVKPKVVARVATPLEPTPVTVSSREDLPRYLKVLTAKNGEIQIAMRSHGDIVAMTLEEKDVIVVVSANAYRGAVYKALLAEIHQKGFKIRTVAKADPGLIQAIYSTSLIDADRDVDSKTERAIEVVIDSALSKRASDIHIEIREDKATLKYRVNGELERQTEWHPGYAMQVARALHTMADQDSKQQTFTESDGQSLSITRLLPSGNRVKLRGQTTPAYPDGGLDVVMRIHRVGATEKVKTFEKLGYARSHIAMLIHMLAAPSGVIVFAGTTGSGKTTSLNTMLTMFIENNPGLKVITIEDPPEYVLHGATQIPVVRRRASDGSLEKENPFARTMRNAMRLDPDAILVGEVRDPESGECAVAMVQSGHKVFTTIHASSAIDIGPRIASNGVTPKVFSSEGFVTGMIYQRLVPVLCPDCREPYHSHMDIGKPGIHERIRRVVKPADKLFVRGKGCNTCHKSGIVDRTVCAEVIIPDAKLRSLLEHEGTAAATEYWKSLRSLTEGDYQTQSMIGLTALDHAILKMRAGILSPVDVEIQLGHLTGNAYVETADDRDAGTKAGLALA